MMNKCDDTDKKKYTSDDLMNRIKETQRIESELERAYILVKTLETMGNDCSDYIEPYIDLTEINGLLLMAISMHIDEMIEDIEDSSPFSIATDLMRLFRESKNFSELSYKRHMNDLFDSLFRVFQPYKH